MTAALLGLALLASIEGHGAYAEVGFDSAWNDRIGFVARGGRAIGEFGYFHGEYQSRYTFGTFWRYGIGFSWEPIHLRGLRDSPDEPRHNLFLEQYFHPHLALSRGAHLFRIGFWWKLRAGPVWTVDQKDVFLDKTALWGGQVSGEISGAYNTNSIFSLAPRLGFGLLADNQRLAAQVTLGLGFHFQFPFHSVGTEDGQKADYWEKDYPPPAGPVD
jgi:hypothetical protein